jgi:hypothetical protein
MSNVLFSNQLAFNIARFSSYERGKEYFEDGCVEKIWKEGDEYKAIVRGTHPYKVSLQFDGEELTYSCSCPFELDGICKHVVAAIFAFSSDKKFSIPPMQKKTEKNESIINELISKTTASQQRIFLEKMLKKQPPLVEDLKIFLQGQQSTPTTISDYKTKFRNRLDQLDLKELLQMWYQEGEDYYDDQYDEFTTESLEDVVDEFIEMGEKYEENQNYGEALKIYQAIFEALYEKQKTIHGELSDLSDWFGQEMDKVITFYVKTLAKADNKNLKEIGIKFLCSVFECSSIYIDKEQVLTGLKQVIINKAGAKYALDCLKFKTKTGLLIEESSLLAFLYLLAEDWKDFENISLKNFKENPRLTLDLLKYYQKNNHKDKIIEIANKALEDLTRKNKDNGLLYQNQPLNYKDIEIEIRRFLKTVYSSSENYQMMIDNAEKLFLATGSLSDYKELVKMYKNQSEKENFWIVIKKHFDDEYEIKKIFKVFKLENQKQEILELIKKYPQAECFSEMVAHVREKYPQECFYEYKKKITEILKETDVRKYSEAAYYLKRMKEIGLDKEFTDFISWIKTTYWRRRKLLEELQENQIYTRGLKSSVICNVFQRCLATYSDTTLSVIEPTLLTK